MESLKKSTGRHRREKGGFFYACKGWDQWIWKNWEKCF
jgi:hypothetical protein